MQLSQFLLPLAGGVLIGLASSALLWTHGKVAGISGLYSGIWDRHVPDRSLRISFVAGLLAAGLAFVAFRPSAFGEPTVGLGAVALAGLLVGFGTKMGNGCTSGHGVCGISRLAPRSIVATLTFIATGALTVLLLKRFGGGQ
jgi:uncharacterized membrane protein YedE/YeeE